MASLQQLCMDVLTSSLEWQQDFLLLNTVDSSIANRMVARLLPMFELKPQHLTFFAGAATELSLDGITMKGSPDCAEWCHYAMYWRGIERFTWSNCPRLKDEHLQALKHAPSTLMHLTFESCVRLTLSILATLPRDISLHSLAFKNCSSSGGCLPDRVSLLSQLTLLDLSGHELTDQDVPKLTPLTTLKSLDLTGSQIKQEGIDQLSVLSSLTFLDISWTLAQHPPPLPHLRTLRMDSCDFGGPWDLAYAMHASMNNSASRPFARIAQLSLNSCRYEAPDGSKEGAELLAFILQAAVNSLHTLSLQGTRLTTPCLHSILECLPQARLLESLDLVDLGALPPTSLTPLHNLPKLSKLRLKSPVTMGDGHLAALAEVGTLKDLEIAEADEITDEGLASLLQNDIASSLTRLVLGSRRMRGHCDYIMTFRPPDEDSHVHEDEPVVGWAHMPRLVELQLTAADADTVIAQACTACTALQSLVITGGQVLQSSLAPAASLRSLTRLEFCGGLPCSELVDTLLESTSLRMVVLRCWIPESAVYGNQTQVFWPPQRLKQVLQRRGGDFVILGAKGVLGEEGAWAMDVPWPGPVVLGSSPPSKLCSAGTSSGGGGSARVGGSRGGGARVTHQTTGRNSDKGGMKGLLRLRYSKATLLAMRHRPECNKGLRELGCSAVVPAVLAKSPW